MSPRTHVANGRIARRRNQRGAVLVEAAIVFIPLCLIVFGIIEYGFIFKDSLTLSSATRSGARMGSAMPNTDPTTVFMPQVSDAVAKNAAAAGFKNGDQMWIYLADANGDASAGCTTNCVKYTWNSTTKKWVGPTGTWNTLTVNSCLGGTIDSVGVRLQLSHDAITGFFTNLQLHERTVMKFEPTTSTCP